MVKLEEKINLLTKEELKRLNNVLEYVLRCVGHGKEPDEELMLRMMKEEIEESA